MEIFDELAKERKYQDEKWGGADFDDTHEEEDWIGFIQEYLHAVSERTKGRPFRVRLGKIAALAMAAIEWAYRKYDLPDPPSQGRIYHTACGLTVCVDPDEIKTREKIDAILNCKQPFVDRMMTVLAHTANLIYIVDKRAL